MSFLLLFSKGGALLDWLLRPPGIYVGLVLLALGLGWGGHALGYRQGVAACEVAHQAAAAREIARQERSGQAVVRHAEVAAVAAAVKDRQNRESIGYVVKMVAAAPDAQRECIAAAVADRLRALD